MARADTYTMVTERITDALERGDIPWRKPWRSSNGGAMRNAVSDKPYRGINPLLLSLTANTAGYSDPRWLTYRQAAGLGGHVRKGEKGTQIVFWKVNERTQREIDPATGKPKIDRYAMLRHYTVFNTEQVDGVDFEPITASENAFDPVDAAESVVSLYAGKPPISHGGDSAYYSPALDQVHIPAPRRFVDSCEYYSVLFHELTHSTGHVDRLNRRADGWKAFGTEDYSTEELVAEFGAAFLCGETGIINATVENSAAYIQSWLKRLNDDPKLAITAASAAQKAADWILGDR